MPIRMEQDDPKGGRRQPQPSNNNRGGAGNLGRILPFLLLFLFRRPKLIIPVLVIGGIWFFFFGGQDMLFGPAIADENSDNQEFQFGATLDSTVYDKAEVFEPLSYGASSSGLPARASLRSFAPERGYQGRQGSCVGWASSYAARTILHASVTKQNPDRVAFSPSYLYNQIALSGCQGAYMRDAMEFLTKQGTLQFKDFPYNEGSCSMRPNANQQSQAQQFKIKGYNRLTLGANNYTPDIEGIKQHLAQGAPVVIGMQVGGSFMSQMRGTKVWNPTRRDYSLYGYSGHAMCVIGYDDQEQGGAFEIMNSWGSSWGQDGIGWVRYDDFRHFVKEAYGLYPMGTSEKYDPNQLAVQFGLVANNGQQLIPLEQKATRTFGTKNPISVGDKFKVAITNSIECYVYVFGEETDGSSYVLFPYTEKHSAYCGITGTRLFPRDYSMTADNLGTKDRIAIVVSKDPLDFQVVNQRLNQSRQRSYLAKLREAIGPVEIADVQFSTNNAISFSTETKGKSAVGVVIELDKR